MNQSKQIVWIKHHLKERRCDICFKYELTRGIWKHDTIVYTYKGNYSEEKLIHWFYGTKKLNWLKKLIQFIKNIIFVKKR
jgi:hypothetical protein